MYDVKELPTLLMPDSKETKPANEVVQAFLDKKGIVLNARCVPYIDKEGSPKFDRCQVNALYKDAEG